MRESGAWSHTGFDRKVSKLWAGALLDLDLHPSDPPRRGVSLSWGLSLCSLMEALLVMVTQVLAVRGMDVRQCWKRNGKKLRSFECLKCCRLR